MAKPTGASWGTDFSEFTHLQQIPATAAYYPQRETQGATTDGAGYVHTGPIRHLAVSLSALGVTSPDGNDMAMRIVMPPSNFPTANGSSGRTSRYQLSSFWRNATQGDDYWVSWWDMLATDWNISSGQITNNGTSFTAIGHTNRYVDTGNNGPLCYISDCTFRNAKAQRQAGLNMIGTTAQNGDGALQKGIMCDIVLGQWNFWEVHYHWSHGSDGRIDFYRNGTLVHSITGANMQTAGNSIQQRIGYYQGSAINHTRTYYVASHYIGPTRASVQPLSGGPPPPPPPGPVAPTNVKATAPSQTSVTLTWDTSPDPNFAYFAVRRNTANLPTDDPSWVRLAPNFTTPTATDTGLLAGTTYYYFVTEVNNATPALVSLPSAVVSVTTPSTTNTAPNPLVATLDRNAAVVNLSWPASPDANFGYFAVRYNTQNLPTTDPSWIRDPINYTTPSAVEVLDPGTYYFFVTKNSNATPTVTSAPSNVVSLTFMADPPPPVQIGAGVNSITINLTPPPEGFVAGDQWQIVVEGQEVATLASSTTSYTYTSATLSDGLPVQVQVGYGQTGRGTPVALGELTSLTAGTAGWRSFDLPSDLASSANLRVQYQPFAAGTLGSTDSYVQYVAFVRGTKGALPGSVTGLSATAGDAQVTLTWIARPSIEGVSSYTVLRNGTTIATGVTTTSYVDTGLSNGITYTYSVLAINTTGSSAAASVTSTPQGTVVTDPTSLSFTATAGQSVPTQTINVTPQPGAANVGFTVTIAPITNL
jgi:fibronectin type 3 domain-containing protein